MAADFSIEVDFIGLRDAMGRFGKGEALFAEKFAEVQELSRSTEQTYAAGAPRRTGAFAKSFTAKATSNAAGFRMELSTDQGDLRRWIRDGTKPHEIRVKNARVLTDGKSFFGPLVHHPGTKPNPWEEGAQHKAEEELRFFGNRIAARVKI